MSNNISKLFGQSQLAFAAYANLVSGISGDAYKNSLINAGMVGSQATDFASKWTVVDQYKDASGVSATVFQEIASGKRYLAIRGTEGLVDFGIDYILANGFPSQLNPQFGSLRDQINLWTASGVLPDTFIVTGHSLGGYLADAVAMQFGSRVSGVYTYNAPGVDGLFSPIVDALRSALGVSGLGTLSNVTNVRATTGLSLISGLGNQVAPPLLIETESSLNPIANHSIVGLTDSLALYDLYTKLAPNLDADKIKILIQSASATMSDSLEKALDQMRAVFLGESALSTGKTPTDNREDFYKNLNALLVHPNFIAAANRDNSIISLTGTAGGTLVTKAKSDFGYFFALKTLAPFAVVNADAVFSQASATLYKQWNDDKALSAGDHAQGKANFTDEYLADRAAMLSWIIKRNRDDNDDTHMSGPNDGLFRDMATNTEIRLQAGFFPVSDMDKRRILFGDKNDNALSGGTNSNRRYGACDDLGNSTPDSNDGRWRIAA